MHELSEGVETMSRRTAETASKRIKRQKCPHCLTYEAPEWTERSPDGLSKCSQCGKESPNPAWIVFEEQPVANTVQGGQS